MAESLSSRQKRLQFLARMNRGRTEFQTYVEQLAQLLKVKIDNADRLDLEATDHIFAAQVKQYQESKHQPQHCFLKTWPLEPTEVWSEVCTRTGVALRGLKGVLFAGPYEYCGAVTVDVERALQVAHSLLDFDGDTLRLAAVDGPSGLYLDRYEQDSERFVKLVVWGEWSNLIAPVIAG